MNPVQVGVGVRGSLFECPVELRVLTGDGSLAWEGVLHVRHKRFSKFVKLVDPGLLEFDDVLGALVGVVDGLIGDISFDLDVRHQSDLIRLELDIDQLKLRVVRASATTAVAVCLTKSVPQQAGSLGWILQTLHDAQAALGIDGLFLVYRKGPGISMAELTGSVNSSALPTILSDKIWLAYGRFAFSADSKAGKAIGSLLGIHGLDLYLGMDPTNSRYALCLSFGSIDNQVFCSKELYLAVALDSGVPTVPIFAFNGSFQFKILPDVKFIANCEFTPDSFLLAAQMDVEDRVALPFLNWIYLAEGGLAVGIADGAPIFGVFATMYLRNQMVFGAVMMALEGGEVPVPLLASGAIDPVSLPGIYRNLTGSDLPGLDSLDVVSLDRLSEWKLPSDFDPALLDKHDAVALAGWFNRAVAGNDSVVLDPDRIHIRVLPNGFALVDQARMRHYFVERSGTVSLQSQFYVSIQPTEKHFGGYTIAPGIFFCGALTLFGKRFEALFALRKDDGLLAYAKLDEIHFVAGAITIFTVRASDDATKDPRPLDGGGLADQLIPDKPTGVVFFLSACKTETTFFLTGHVDFLGLFKLDARVVYASRYLSVHTESVLWGVRVVLQLDISWSDYQNACFKFKFQIDTAALTQALTSVTQAIDRAIQDLKTTMSGAFASLNAAQGNVDQLHHEIDDLDRRIADCKHAIRDASWWKKAFVAIAKGAEIAAYEVAEAGIWTAIGVATAALNLAKIAVAAFGSLGTEILQLVNSTIRAATNLLFLRSAEILADVSPQGQNFKAAIAFRALGKDYDYSTDVKLDLLQGGDLLSFLSKELLAKMNPDLKNVAKGKPPQVAAVARSAMRNAKTTRGDGLGASLDALPDANTIPPIDGAALEIGRASGIMDLIQSRYREAFGEELAEFGGWNANFAAALHLSAAGLGVANQAARQSDYSNLLQKVGELDASHLNDDDKKRLDVAMNQLNQALQSGSSVLEAQQAAERAQVMTTDRASVVAPSGSTSESTEQADQRMVQFLSDLEKEIHERFGDATPGYIDLSLEPALRAHFERAHLNLGSVRSATTRPFRLKVARARRGKTYQPRL